MKRTKKADVQLLAFGMLLALVENFEPDELIGRGGGRTFIPFDSGNGKMKVEVEIIK